MPQQLKWDPFTGILERTPEAPKTQPPIPPKLTADYADAEEKTKAFLDGVHAKEKIHLTAYDLMRENIRNARDSGERRYFESLFDQGHNKTVTQHDESVRNRDTAVRNVWSVFAETWPGTTCKLTTAALAPSGKTYRTVEVESPYLGKKVIGPTKVPEERYMVDESSGGFRPLAREPPGFLPQRYTWKAPIGFGHPPSASRPDLETGLSVAEHDRWRREFQSLHYQAVGRSGLEAGLAHAAYGGVQGGFQSHHQQAGVRPVLETGLSHTGYDRVHRDFQVHHHQARGGFCPLHAVGRSCGVHGVYY